MSLLRLTPLFLASRGLTAGKSRSARDTALKEKLVCRTGVIFPVFQANKKRTRSAKHAFYFVQVSRPKPASCSPEKREKIVLQAREKNETHLSLIAPLTASNFSPKYYR